MFQDFFDLAQLLILFGLPLFQTALAGAQLVHRFLQLLNVLGEAADRPSYGVREAVVIELDVRLRVSVDTFSLNHPPRYADNCGVGRNRTHHHRTRADLAVITKAPLGSGT